MPTIAKNPDAPDTNAPDTPSPGVPPAKTKRTKAEKAARRAKRAEKSATDTEATEATEVDPFYCPGCGKRWKFLTECRGMTNAAPHPPILVISTDELSGDPANHTPAPDSPTGV